MSMKRPKPNFTLSAPKRVTNEERVKEALSFIARKPIEGIDLDKKELLGEGQYGKVYRVIHKGSQIPMAMKQIEFTFDEQGLKQLRTELDVLHNSESPFIVKFYGSFLRDTFACYCMEYMDYGSLDKLYAGGVPEPVLAKIAIAMVRGLKYMKDELNTIHRDVKPTNVLMNRDGEIKLCDFGVSGTLVQSVAKTFTGCSFYMAPERIDTTKSSSEYDVRSDVWSLGISLVEIGNGEKPFKGIENSGVFALLDQIVQGQPPKLNASFSDEARNFVNRCLEKESQKRASYEQLLQDPWIQRYEQEQVDVSQWLHSLKATPQVP